MADSDRAYIGTQPCGCITWALAAPESGPNKPTKRSLEADLKRAVKEGLKVEQTTVGQAKARPNFLADCQHVTRVTDVQAEVDRLVGS